MGFSDEQLKALEAKLDPKNVKSRSMAGRNLSYIEGWHAIAEANRIFGFSAWDRETSMSKLSDPSLGKDRYGNDQWRARFMAIVTIRVRAGDDIIIRQGTGYGSGIAKDIGDAYEGAIKEAETDAMKRAMMMFGNQFGLALYDKTQSNVGSSDPRRDAEDFAERWGENRARDLHGAMTPDPEARSVSKEKSRPLYVELQQDIDSADSKEALEVWAKRRSADLDEMPSDWRQALRDRYADKMVDLIHGPAIDYSQEEDTHVQ